MWLFWTITTIIVFGMIAAFLGYYMEDVEETDKKN